MPFPDIQLDDRTFENLVQEAQRRIPAYTPEWTDFNDSDPGITLIQLFAWLEEIILYRLNQVPDKNFIKFLDLIGLQLNPPSPATAELTFKLSTKDLPYAVLIPQATKVSAATSGSGGPVIFETDDNLYAVGAELQAVQTFDGAQFTLQTEANRVNGAFFYPFSTQPQAGMAVLLGFDRAFPTGQQRLTIHVSSGAGAAQGSTAGFTPQVSAIWEYWSGDTTQWKALTVDRDDTLNFTNSGVLLFEGPSDMVAVKYGLLQGTSDPPLFWIRNRIDQLLGAGYEMPPQIEDVLINTVSATNSVTETNEMIGASTGLPNQTFSLLHSPILPKDPSVPGIIAVDEGSGFQVWTEVPDFARSKREDQHYTLNYSTAVVTFGDGENGKIPRWLSADKSNTPNQDDPNIMAVQYRWGGGLAGNVGPGAISSLESAVPYVDSVTNLRTAVGGQDEESVEDAKTRAPGTIRSQSRAVTADDFEFLAKQTPGAQIRRAKALPLYNPDLELARPSAPGLPIVEVPIPGVVTVLVVPESPNPMPIPSQQTTNLVSGWLNQHRIITTEVYVRGPKYRKVFIQARVTADPTANKGQVAQNLQNTLLNFFHPLRGGPDGGGWDFGGTIYFSETYKVILDSPGVLRIESGAVQTYLDDVLQPPAQDIQLNVNELVFSVNHDVQVSYA